MSTLRRDPIVGRWVVDTDKLEPLSTTLQKLGNISAFPKCPLCRGSEGDTPPEVFAIRSDGSKPNTPGWEVRVIPNFTAAMRVEGNLNRRPELMYDEMDSIGAHELVIGSPEHFANLVDLPEPQIAKIFRAYINRLRDLKKDMRLRSIFIYGTYGKRALLESLPHTHSHIIATPVTPKLIKEQYVGCRTYYEYKERCVYCDIIKQELRQGKRIVTENDGFVAITPFASRFSHEIWILPKKHSCDFENSPESDLPWMASILKEILTRIRALLGDPPYNLALFNGPNRNGREGYWLTIEYDYHWHIEIMPTFTRPEGFEWATGFYINDTTPETAARRLREVKL
ncbi:MAG: galactose-1-phosphate uridylyltransferase [candidate division Zixibacteria bacterium CG_4_9_14_3_um_filter_46_8]|nr:MAG: galactose-1-phosphate uridylyltransferase [candidate division Zixibacteria bacterium CG_4_9_14_3_um_filter_46_8]